MRPFNAGQNTFARELDDITRVIMQYTRIDTTPEALYKIKTIRVTQRRYSNRMTQRKAYSTLEG